MDHPQRGRFHPTPQKGRAKTLPNTKIENCVALPRRTSPGLCPVGTGFQRSDALSHSRKSPRAICRLGTQTLFWTRSARKRSAECPYIHQTIGKGFPASTSSQKEQPPAPAQTFGWHRCCRSHHFGMTARHSHAVEPSSSPSLFSAPASPEPTARALVLYGDLSHLDQLALRPHLRWRCWRRL